MVDFPMELVAFASPRMTFRPEWNETNPVRIDVKSFLGGLAVAISVLAYVIYIWQTIKKDGIRPHPFSWLLWGFVTTVATFAQHAKGAGAGLWVTAFTAVVCVIIGTLTLSKNKWRNRGRCGWLQTHRFERMGRSRKRKRLILLS